MLAGCLRECLSLSIRSGTPTDLATLKLRKSAQLRLMAMIAKTGVQVAGASCQLLDAGGRAKRGD